MNWTQKWARIRSKLPTREDFAAQDEQAEQAARGTTPVAEVQLRQRVGLYGVLRSVTYPPTQKGGSFSATLFDGTGSIDLIWLGRRFVPGIEPGIHIHVEGMIGERGGTLCVMNPSYQIVANEGE